VPEYLKMQGSLKAAKIDEVIVYCVNDGAVMEAWEENQMADDSDLVNFMADARCELTRALGMVIDPTLVAALGNPRAKRFCLYIDDGTIKVWAVSEADGDPAGDNEPDGPIAAKTRAPAILEAIKALE
jgi:2-Cys peroxiredoxin 5